MPNSAPNPTKKIAFAIWKYLKKWYSIVGVIITIFAWLGINHLDWFKSKHQKHAEKNEITGMVKSPKFSDNVTTQENIPSFNYNTEAYKYPLIKGVYIKGLSKMKGLTLTIANGVGLNFEISDLYKGVNFFQYRLRPIDCDGLKLWLIAKDDRLYASARFIDLDDNEMGEMEYNHWKIYDNKFLDFSCTDQSFELIDNKGLVAFSLSYSGKKGEPFVYIRGYFISPVCAFVIDGSPDFGPIYINDSSNWKRQVKVRADKIPRKLKPECN